MPNSPARPADARTAPARSRRVIAVIAIAGLIVLLTLAAAFAVEGLAWFVPQGWALRVLAVAGLVAWAPLGRMGRVGAVVFAVGVALFTVIDVMLTLWPQVGVAESLSGIGVPVSLFAIAGFFVLVFGAIRSASLPWWTTPVMASAAIAVWAIGMLAAAPSSTQELLVQHIVAQNYLFAVAVVSVIAAIIDGVRYLKERRRA